MLRSNRAQAVVRGHLGGQPASRADELQHLQGITVPGLGMATEELDVLLSSSRDGLPQNTHRSGSLTEHDPALPHDLLDVDRSLFDHRLLSTQTPRGGCELPGSHLARRSEWELRPNGCRAPL